MTEPTTKIDPKSLPAAGNRLYQEFDIEEDRIRISSHYEQDPEFFYILTGGGWHTYSCSFCAENANMTEAQARKLDLLAERMELKPGMYILDVGCGWGGPLVYLCKRYNVRGLGIAVTPKQIAEAQKRAAFHGVDAQFQVMHWKSLPEVETFDVIYTDETIVHFQDLGGFFAKCHKVLKAGHLMVHKELHLTHSSYSKLGRISEFVNEIYSYTGNYIPLYRELELLDQNGFQLKNITEISMEHYRKTLDVWLKSMFDNRERMKTLEGPEMYERFRVYLKSMRYLFTHTDIFGLHVVTSRKMSQANRQALE
jgi:cyclopropane-fatty-acyl-phospholipid synthase